MTGSHVEGCAIAAGCGVGAQIAGAETILRCRVVVICIIWHNMCPRFAWVAYAKGTAHATTPLKEGP